MGNVQDPKRQVSYLQQRLSSSTIPLGFFLGAGCPMAIKVDADRKLPLIPDIAGITKLVRDELMECEDNGPLLKKVEEHFKNDGKDNATVEDMLSHIRALHMVAGKDEVRGMSAKNLEDLDKRICSLLHVKANQVLPNIETPYHRIAAWIDAIGRDKQVEVFTTNYDLLMEQAFEECRVPYFDGFAGSRKPFFDLQAMEEDKLPQRWARLWKLHGSINWYQVSTKGVFRGSTMDDTDSMRVIYPSHLKYEESRRMPYLAMIDRLRAFLNKPTATLVICGYSFRDQHINEVIRQGLQSTPKAIAFALLFDKITEYSEATALASKRPNLNILARDGAVISGQNAKWPEMDPESVSLDKWVKWAPVDPSNNKSKLKAEFTLGDFAVFGQFLQEIVGDVQQMLEVPSVQ